MAALILEEDGKRTLFDLKEGENPVGRLPENVIQLLGGTVSGRHARVVHDGGAYFVEDVGSRNGTFVNQQKIESRVRLNHNDVVHFGQTPLRFDDPGSPQPPAGAALMGAEAADTGLLSGIRPAPAPAAVNKTTPVPPQPVPSDDYEDDDQEITGSLSSQGRFGVLDVNPEAKLKAVLEISSSLAGAVDLEALLPKILDALFTIFKYADRGCVLLKEESSGKMVPRASRHRRQGADATVRPSRTIINKVLTEKAAVRSADASTDAAFSGSQSISDLKIRSMMCAPLLGLDGEPAGIISIDSQNPLGQFSDDDLGLLMTVAGQAALSYETARLMQTFLDKQKQDNEMKIAQGVQRALLPEKLPTAEGYEFYASYDAAQAVGGDYYDCFVLSEGRIVLSFGDVAGKGVPGALIMSRMHSCVQSTLKHVQDVEGAMLAINEHMCDSAVEGRFVTYVLCIVDTVNHQLTLSNAGHMSPLVRHADGTVDQFDDDLVGPPIGVVDDYPYEVETRSLKPGDTVVIVTDGVDEAMNPEGELYGTERVIEFVKNSGSDAEQLGKTLLTDVRRHANGRAQNDDITIMTFGRNAS